MTSTEDARDSLERVHTYVDRALEAIEVQDAKELAVFVDAIESALFRTRSYIRHQEEMTA